MLNKNKGFVRVSSSFILQANPDTNNEPFSVPLVNPLPGCRMGESIYVMMMMMMMVVMVMMMMTVHL